MSAIDELLPCPFCGGEAHTYKNNLWHVACERAHNGCVTMSAFITEAEAVEAWNRRIQEQAIAATLGGGTCHMSFIDEYETASGEEEYLCECSECGYRRWESAHDLPLFCSKCGSEVGR